jgi:hypothetical protein
LNTKIPETAMTTAPRPQAISARIPPATAGAGGAFHAAIFLLAFTVVIARRPDAVFHAQFYAEDGSKWFADAYNYGWWRVLLSPYEGYLHLVPRITGAIALLVPFSRAALVENLIAISLYAVPVNLLLSSRSAPWGSFKFRALLASIYLFLPNTWEVIANFSESEWIVALLALLLLVALPPRTPAACAVDLTVFALFSLTGPFCFFFLPTAVFMLWRMRLDQGRRAIAGILLLGCMAQGSSLFLHASARPHPVLGANPEWFARLIGGQVYLGTLFGVNRLAATLSLGAITSVAIAGTVIVILCALHAPAGMRALILLAFLLFIASLATPNTSPPPGTSAWEMLAGSPGVRYWFFPTVAFAWSIAYCATSSPRGLRAIAICLFVVMATGFVRDFRYPGYRDLTSPEYARRLAAAPPGTTVSIPINPPGWTMRLTQR